MLSLVLTGRCAFAERRMFGGLAFMIDGHMGCGVVGDALMLRVGPDGYQDALARPHARPMDFTGRPLTGMVYVDPAGFRTEKALVSWIGRALSFIQTLPARGTNRATRGSRARR